MSKGQRRVRHVRKDECPDAGSGGRKSSAGALWGVILAVCAAPIAISLAVGLTALTVALGLVVLCAAVGAGAAGVGCIAMGAVAVWAGFAALLGHGIATTMYFVGGIGLLLLGGVVFLGGAALRGAAWLLERVLRRGEARA